MNVKMRNENNRPEAAGNNEKRGVLQSKNKIGFKAPGNKLGAFFYLKF